MRTSHYLSLIISCFVTVARGNDNIFDHILECSGITSIINFPYAMGGTTRLTNVLDIPIYGATNENNNEECMNAANHPGVWYKVQGNDNFLRAKLSIDAEITNQKMVLFEGPKHIPCGNEQVKQFKCLSHPSENPRELVWFAKKEKTYYFRVFGVSPEESGAYLLQMDEVFYPRPGNDQCSMAQVLKRGQKVTGNSVGSWPHNLNNEKCRLSENSRGLFYSIKGNGETISLSLRPEVGIGRMEMALLIDNDCSTCIANSAFISAGDARHILQFHSNKDETYTLVVSGQGMVDNGYFELTWEVSTLDRFRSNVIISFSSFLNFGMFVLVGDGIS